jgi:hypothetical protein
MARLKAPQRMEKRRRARRERGLWMLERSSGMAGRRKRGSWWGIRERRAIDVLAVRRMGEGRGWVRSRRSEGPRRMGRLTSRWVQRGWMPWRVRLSARRL